MFKKFSEESLIEAGCDEAGRGCLAGPVFAGAVILPDGFEHSLLNDSKQMTRENRDLLRGIIEKEAVCWSVAQVDHKQIDAVNILNASIKAMHKAISRLKKKPDLLLIDGNRFKKYKSIMHQCIIQGDGLYYSIAAASVLAKTHRDEYMLKLHKRYPVYGWDTNKAYATEFHRNAILEHGQSPFHRKSFRLKPEQYKLELDFLTQAEVTGDSIMVG